MSSITDNHAPTPVGASPDEGASPASRSRLRRARREGRQTRTPLSPARLRRRRRRLLLGSAPAVAVLIVIALRLLSLNLVHAQTLAGYQAGDKPRTQTWAQRQGWVNIVERFRAPFAMGDAQLLLGHYDLARPWFEEAFTLVPKGGVEDCKVRVNLGLTYEKLGDAARARERTTEWKQFYDLGITITKERPPLCDVPERGGTTGEQLSEAQERMEDKSGGQPAPDPQPQPQPSAPDPQPQPAPTPNPDNAPSERDQQRLQEQQKQNTIERNLRNRGSGDTPGDGSSEPYPRPW